MIWLKKTDFMDVRINTDVNGADILAWWIVKEISFERTVTHNESRNNFYHIRRFVHDMSHMADMDDKVRMVTHNERD